MENQKFQKGEIHTHFIDEEYEKEKLSGPEDKEELHEAVAVFSALLDYQERKNRKPVLSSSQGKSKDSPWKIAGRKTGLRRFGQ